VRIHFVASSSPAAAAALEDLVVRYGQCSLDVADVVVPVGGDGFMLETLHALSTAGSTLPVYGTNLGNVGFLLNEHRVEDLPERVDAAVRTALNPLEMSATDTAGDVHRALAVNDVSLLRASPQSAHLSVRVDDVAEVDLAADGALVATSAGSTAYNLAAGGSVIPLGAPVLALTTICPIRPRGWGGALVHASSVLEFEVLEHVKRPVSVTADTTRVELVTRVEVRQSDEVFTLLFDPGRDLKTRINAQLFGRYEL
jgi:NAD+ kinase